jgi:hypothetical protein
MRRALPRPRFDKIELNGGQICGVPSESTYDPLDLYERGMAPHLAFASAGDPLQWHKEYGPLWGFTSAYNSTVEAFLGAQRRFIAVLNLWQAWNRDGHDLRECFLRAVAETGYVTLPGTSVLGLNAEWSAETKGAELPPEAEIAEVADLFAAESKHTQAAEEFARSASRERLRQAAEDLLKYALVARLEGVQPDFGNEKGFEPTWTVRDFLQGCYLMLFFDMTKRQGIRNCKMCSQFFYPTGKRLRFCSTDCARRSRQRRYWKKRGKLLRTKRRK